MVEFSDKELLEMIRLNESSNGFNFLIRKYQKKVYNHVRRMVIDHDDANDIVQDIFIKVWKGIAKFNEDSELYTWIYRITVNETLTFLKKKKRKFFVPIVSLEKELGAKMIINTDFSSDEIELKLQKALLKLPEKQKMVFNLRYYDEMPYEEMSKILNTSVGALKASYHIAVKKVEENIQDN